MAKVLVVGFDPRKQVNSVHHVCSECNGVIDIYANHETEELKDKLVCPTCGAEIVVDEIVWQPPVDIADALSKQSTLQVVDNKCPVCGKRFGGQRPNYCSKCGQRVGFYRPRQEK